MSMIINPYRFAASTALTNGLVAWFSMDEASGTRTDDVAGYTLTEAGGTIGSTTGKISNGANMVTADGYHLLNTGDSLTGTNTGTVSAWINVNSISTTQWLFQPYTNRDVYIQSSKIKARVWGAIASAITLSSATWYHCVWTWEVGSVSGALIINDGTPETNATVDSTASDGNLIIGERGTGTGAFGGIMDEVGIWNRILTAAEITELYNSGNGIAYPG